MDKCKCGAKPKCIVTPGKNYPYAQVVCPKCGAKGIKQGGCGTSNAMRAARLTWDAGEREADLWRTGAKK